MNAATLTMDHTEARAKARAYRKQLIRRNDAEYEAAAEAYELLAEGKTLIDVGNAIRGGGFDDKMRPRLAIARADRQQVEFIWWSNEDSGVFRTINEHWRYPQLAESINFNRRPNVGNTVRGFALVPMVPADVRPNVKLSDCHILWEVEQWAVPRQAGRPSAVPRQAGRADEVPALAAGAGAER